MQLRMNLQKFTTGVFFDEALKVAVSDASSSQPMSLVMLDLDRFGTLNKEYGEDVGDRVILAAVEVFRDTFDSDDILIRYGGDEFSFILPGKSGITALDYCNRMGESLRQLDILNGLGGSFKHPSASVGIAVCPDHGVSVQEMVEKADSALYSAKEAGRDQAKLFAIPEQENRKKFAPKGR